MGSEQICGACGAHLVRRCEVCETCGQPALLKERYRLLEVVGQGASGVTYQAEDLTNGHRVAIKEMAYRRAASLKALELFTREAEVLRTLSHPGIPAYLDHFDAGSGKARSLYLVQEFLEGKTLAQEMKERRYTDDEVMGFLEEMLAVLTYLHQLNPPVIHRDIKPENIMRRSGDGRLMLIDFGSVRDAISDRELGGSTVAGTFGYMAPEQFRGVATPQTDIYGLGATAAALLTRTPAHQLLDAGGRLDWQRHVRCAQPVRVLLDEMLSPEAGGRPSGGEEILARAREIRRERRLPAPAGRGAPAARSAGQRSRRRDQFWSWTSPRPYGLLLMILLIAWMGLRAPTLAFIVFALVSPVVVGVWWTRRKRLAARATEAALPEASGQAKIVAAHRDVNRPEKVKKT